MFFLASSNLHVHVYLLIYYLDLHTQKKEKLKPMLVSQLAEIININNKLYYERDCQLIFLLNYKINRIALITWHCLMTYLSVVSNH